MSNVLTTITVFLKRKWQIGSDNHLIYIETVFQCNIVKNLDRHRQYNSMIKTIIIICLILLINGGGGGGGTFEPAPEIM